MKIIVGTQNPTKIKAIKTACKKCIYFKKDIEIVGKKIESGISDMPKTLKETMTGARNRAENLKKKNLIADYYIGMEGGTTQIQNETFLFGVIYILNNNSKGHFGISNMMKVPNCFVKEIYEKGKELGPILSDITGIKDASKKAGAFGAWSDNMLTREDQFVFAFLSAIVPFYNKYYKI